MSNLFDKPIDLSVFDEISDEIWIEKINKDLKNPDAYSKLIKQHEAGFKVNPFYTKVEGSTTDWTDNRTDNSWGIAALINDKDLKKSKDKLYHLLNHGVNAPIFGSKIEEQDFEKLTEDLKFEFVQTGLSQNFSKSLFQSFSKQLETDKKYDISIFQEKNISLLEEQESLQNQVQKSVELLGIFKNNSIKSTLINGETYHNNGASIHFELGALLSKMNHFVQELQDKFSVEQILNSFTVQLPISVRYFDNIAKIRSLKLLWKSFCKAYGIKKEPELHVFSTSSKWTQTGFGENENLLRLTTEAMSAIIGGTNTLFLSNFNNQQDDNFAQRISKNIQLVLQEESYFGKVKDPAKGSYFIENLTLKLVDAAWKVFQEIETLGGYKLALENDFISKNIEEQAKHQQQNLAKGKTVLVGNTQYAYEGKQMTEPNSEYYLSNELEALRTKIQAQNFAKESILIVPFGKPNIAKQKSIFAANFLRIAGIEAIENDRFETTELAQKTIQESSAKTLILCVDDDINDFLSKIKLVSGNKKIIIAGAEKSVENKNDVDLFINKFSNRIQQLEQISAFLTNKN